MLAALIVVAASPAAALSSDESCFYNAINRERARVGRPRLELKSDLSSIARRHSRRMAADGTIYHNNNLGNEIPGNWYAAGENVGMGPDCATIHDAFMASPGHRANIIDRDYNQTGVGVAYDEDRTLYITEVFAGRRGSSSPRRTAVRKPAKRKTVAARPRTAPPKAPVAKIAEARTISMLLQLLGYDAKRVNKATGEALGV
jgi:hypothetical protein